MKQKIIQQGAEAIILKEGNSIIKRRNEKKYRIKEIDEKIRKLRTRSEAKLLEKSAKVINIPKISKVDEKNKEISMEFIEGKKLSEELNKLKLKKQKRIFNQIGKDIAKLHKEDIIHGDLTTSNMILKEKKIFFIDFGLGFFNGKYEDKAVDIHLLKQALEAKHFENEKELFNEFQKGYFSINKKEAEKVFQRLKIVEKRGRYKH